MGRHTTYATAMAALLALSTLAIAGVAAADEHGLEIDVAQEDEDVVVTVTDNGSAVEGASVDAALGDETRYAGTTDGDGEVGFEAPNETVELAFQATYENATAEETEEIVGTEALEGDDEDDGDGTESDDGANESDDESTLSIGVTQDDGVLIAVTENDSAAAGANVTVTVDEENASYDGEGDHVAADDGTVRLESPEENVTVVIEAVAGNATGETTVTLEAADDGPENFGALVSAFVHDQHNESDGPLGIRVANFVIEHSPGNAPDHAGPPEHAGPENESERGPPAHAGGQNGDDESERGPPEHAGGPGGDEAGRDDGGANANGNGGTGQGPPSHANSGGD